MLNQYKAFRRRWEQIHICKLSINFEINLLYIKKYILIKDNRIIMIVKNLRKRNLQLMTAFSSAK